MDKHQSSMRDRPAGAGTTVQPEREPADYIFRRGDIPLEIRAFALSRLGNDAPVHPARRNGSYKGSILLNSDDWLVQVISRNTKTAIVHRKADVTLIGAVRWRDENKRLGGITVQVHYNDGNGKAYPLRDEQSRLRSAHPAEQTRVSTDIER